MLKTGISTVTVIFGRISAGGGGGVCHDKIKTAFFLLGGLVKFGIKIALLMISIVLVLECIALGEGRGIVQLPLLVVRKAYWKAKTSWVL